jgi:hypothetical protein
MTRTGANITRETDAMNGFGGSNEGVISSSNKILDHFNILRH